MTVIDYPDWATAQAHADKIAITGAPLIPKDAQLFNTSTGGPIVLTPGQTTTVLLDQDMSSNTSYHVSVDGLTLTAEANPFYRVALLWHDLDETLVDGQHWNCLATDVSPAVNNTLIVGRGPCEAATVEVNLRSFALTQNITLDFVFDGSSRLFTDHNWTSFSNNTSGSAPFLTPISSPTSNLLGGTKGQVLAAGATLQRINALRSGRLAFLLTQDAPLQSLDFDVYAVVPDQAADPQPNLIHERGFTGAVFYQEFLCPRGPTLVVVTNRGGVATTNLCYKITCDAR